MMLTNLSCPLVISESNVDAKLSNFVQFDVFDVFTFATFSVGAFAVGVFAVGAIDNSGWNEHWFDGKTVESRHPLSTLLKMFFVFLNDHRSF